MNKISAFLLLAAFASLFPFSAAAGRFKTVSQATPTATTTSTQILAVDKFRTFLAIFNTGATAVYVKMGSAHSGTEGVVIAAGGSWQPLEAPVESIWVKAASSTDVLNIIAGD